MNNENYYLFIRPPGIKIDQNIFNSTFYFEKTINEIKDQIDSLKKNLDQRRQFEQYLRCKYNLTNDKTNFQKDTYQSFESILCLFNQIIENIDVFDDCNFTIHNLSSFFADVYKRQPLIPLLSGSNLQTKPLPELKSFSSPTKSI